MRAQSTKNGISMKIYAGTTGILLAFNVTAARREGLLGFAIRRKKRNGEWEWLKALLEFPNNSEPTFNLINTNLGPIQKFRWSDYAVYPNTPYTYEVQGVYGTPDTLEYVTGPEIEVSTESITTGKHQVVFNRAVAASQAYTRKFGDKNPEEDLDARKWLTRGLLEKIESFMKRAENDQYALDLALFEFEYDGFVDLLKVLSDKGVKVRVIYHRKKGDNQTDENETHLRPLADNQKIARNTTALFHQKFIILQKKDAKGNYQPQAILTGTTNFTPNGLWRQANVIHIINDETLAKSYDQLFKQLLTSEGRGDTKTYINENHPIATDLNLFYSFSPRSGYVDIDLLETTINTAKSEVFICSAFSIHDRITNALKNKGLSDQVIRYGLQNKRSSITGYHRNESFTVPTYLRDGLENFLKENTKGQKGSIFIHLKTLITDFTTDNPTVIVGSHNFSKPASDKNDENFVLIKGDTAVADTYFCEMMRLYDHYRFRYNRKDKTSNSPKSLFLQTDNSWTDGYFDKNDLKYEERSRFCKV